MICLELPVVLWVAIMQGQLEMQQRMYTHELDSYAASGQVQHVSPVKSLHPFHHHHLQI
jgi:hypothetical protein